MESETKFKKCSCKNGLQYSNCNIYCDRIEAEKNEREQMGGFVLNDIVRSKSKVSFDKNGIVHKISDLGVHVKFENGQFEIFRFKKEHHKHSDILELILIDSNGIRQLVKETEIASLQTLRNDKF